LALRAGDRSAQRYIDQPDLVPLLAKEIRLVRSYWLITHAQTRDLLRVKLLDDFIQLEAAAAGDGFGL
jgi:hypothetical protein